MRRFISLVLSLFLVIAAALPISSAASGTDSASVGEVYGYNDTFRYYIRDGAVEIIAIMTDVADIVIPETIEGYPVRMLLNDSFKNRTSLKSVKLPKSLKYIGDEAFRGCTSLQSINLPKGLEHICKLAFAECKSLTEIVIPDSVTNLEELAFYFCTGLTKVVLPDDLSVIEENTFSHCEKLSSIDLPKNLKTLKTCAFSSCYALTEITIPDSVHYCEYWVFDGCTNLKKITGGRAITGKPLKDLVGSPNFKKVERVTLTSSADTLYSGNFIDCVGLIEVNIPDSVTSIGDEVFYGCSKLKSLYIPDSVTSIGKKAFSGCPELTLYGSAGSYAEKYSKKNNLRFKTGKPEPAQPTVELICGDPDGDGSVTIIDATAIQRDLAGLPTEKFDEKSADADRDGSVTIMDATAIQRHLAGLLTNENIGKAIK